jgi:hypothetical protein
LVEDVRHKATVHDFMLAAAEVVNRKLGEEGRVLMQPVTADDIDVKLEVSATFWQHNHFADSPIIAGFAYRDLQKATE